MERTFQHDYLLCEGYKQSSLSTRGSMINTGDSLNYNCNTKQLQNHQYCFPSDLRTSASDNTGYVLNRFEHFALEHGPLQYNVTGYNSNSDAHFQHSANALSNLALGASSENFHDIHHSLNSNGYTLHQTRPASRVFQPTLSLDASATGLTVSLDNSSSASKSVTVSNLPTADCVNSTDNLREHAQPSTTHTLRSADSSDSYPEGRSREKKAEKMEMSSRRGKKEDCQRLYPCDVCGKILKHRSSFITHQRAHRQEKFFKCKRCGKTFIDQSTVTKHLRTHSGVKPFTCSICQRSFSQSGNLRRHVKRIHVQS